MPRHSAIYTQSDARFRDVKSPEKQEFPRRRGPILVWVSVAALLSLLFFGFQNAYPSLADSQIFQLAEITVVGNKLLTSDTVVAQSGLTLGGSLFDADLTSARGHLSSLPIIQNALLLRQPPGRLVISVSERQPLGLICTESGLVGMDANASVFPIPQTPIDLPVVTGLKGAGDDSRDETDAEQMGRLAEFLETLNASSSWFYDSISEVHLETPQEVTVHLVGDGLRIRMRLVDAYVQARNFAAFVNAGGCRAGSPAYVDLRYTGQVVVGKQRNVTAG